jgi:hypothetical protein
MSEISVGNLKGLASNSNIITVPSGHQLIQSGMTVQTIQRLSSNYGTVSVPAYANNGNNLVQIPDHYVDITTRYANSRIKVMMSFDNTQPNQQHSYTDIRRSISGGTFVSMSNTYRTNTVIDSMASYHGSGTAQAEHSSVLFIIDSPGVAAGTTLRYQTYMGAWAGGTVTFGGWNDNARSLTVMIAEEIAQ